MKFVRNAGNDRVADYLGRSLADGARLDLATSSFSIFAFDHLRDRLQRLRSVRLIIPEGDIDLRLLGEPADRSLRNQLRSRRIAKEALKWITNAVDLRTVPAAVPQGTIVVREDEGEPIVGLLGSLSFTTDGLGITPGNALNLVQLTESRPEAESLGQWFDSTWNSIRQSANGGSVLVDQLTRLSSHQAPYTIYALILHHLFGEREDAMDEERIVRSATGIRDTVIWNKLYSFQKDAVITAIDKLDRYGGCIIADSVGLGKTFEALAVIKYHELRNDRVLVLCPKRLRDNWTLYAANDRRNILARDRFNYDVLNHTDLSRDDGLSGDIDLSHVNWGNYDLVVIDESHNFRNKKSPKKGSETRYDRLMRRIIQEGVKTRVLMLSATPVNNRLADLRNQIAFATEGNDRALAGDGIESIDATTRQAQRQFNRWLELPDDERTTEELVERLGFDYFTLLDRLTIARSRKHVEKYYGTEETGRFPTRREPVNIKTDVDSAGEFPAIGDVNDEIRRLRLAAYAPLRYVLPHRQAAYDSRYSTSIRGGESVFRQADREESLIHLMLASREDLEPAEGVLG